MYHARQIVETIFSFDLREGVPHNARMNNMRIHHVKQLGECAHRSPLTLSTTYGDGIGNFTPADALVRSDIEINNYESGHDGVYFEMAGAREHIFFDPEKIRAAIVTCGGLCPGINNVIRSIYRQLNTYGVPSILGIRNGYQGFDPKEALEPFPLTAEFVEDINREGGTALGSSRGYVEPADILDRLRELRVDILFTIGGDGTQRGTHDLAVEAEKRGQIVSVIGIPKTIDNDISYVSRTFGFNTAIEEARKVLDCAHVEARGAPNGIGLVKLMGRDSGFIAAVATLASQEVNYCLIPEVPFTLHGPDGLLELLKERMRRKRHAVIVAAEGAGQDLIEGEEIMRDKSGNILHKDIGLYLKQEIKHFFAAENIEANIKYFDPSYIIRSVPANADDCLYCDRLARYAVHAAMAGKTDTLIGRLHSKFVHVPVEMAVRERKKIDPESDLWISVYETTGQPMQFMKKEL